MWELMCEGHGRVQTLASNESLLRLRTLLGSIVLDWAKKHGGSPEADYWLDESGNLCEGVQIQVPLKEGTTEVHIYLRRTDRWEPVEEPAQESLFDDEDEPF